MNAKLTKVSHHRNAETTEAAPFNGWSKKFQLFISLLILVHLAGVIAEPFSFFTRSSVRSGAPEATILRRLMAPYVEFVYLGHGYFFFAPNPGPNHLIECRMYPLSEAGASSTESLEPKIEVLPDRVRHWPRLHYHRHFMLSEFYNAIAPSPEANEQELTNPNLQYALQPGHARYIAVRDSMMRHLAARYPGHDIRLSRIEHLLPTDQQVLREHWKLDDPRLYVTLPEPVYSEELSAPQP